MSIISTIEKNNKNINQANQINQEISQTSDAPMSQEVSAKPKFDYRKFQYETFKKAVLNELKLNGEYIDSDHRMLGFTKKEIISMVEHPERCGKNILRLSQHMYLKSGYYKRLVDYFANMAVLRYTVDTKVYSNNINQKTLKSNYLKMIKFADRLNLQNEINDIIRAMIKQDYVFAFKIDNGIDYTYYYLDPMICEISSIVDGNVYQFYIRKSKISQKKKESLPVVLRELLDKSETDKVVIPYENSLCLKYNNDFVYPYPPFFTMIADILLIDDYKDLTKAQSINDAYKLLTLKIPTKDGEITMDDSLITTFTSMTLDTVQDNIGVITTPFDMDTEEFSSSNADDRDTVSDAISWAFKNVGVSEALMSGASSGSELKYSIINDSGDIFRIYRMIEDWVKLQINLETLKGNAFITENYRFSYKILDMTIFNQTDYIDNELKLAQNGVPNKTRLCVASNISPAEMFGNSIIENELFKDVFDNWQPMKTSYVMSGDSDDEGGRPTMDDGDLSASGEVTRENDTNAKPNRDI